MVSIKFVYFVLGVVVGCSLLIVITCLILSRGLNEKRELQTLQIEFDRLNHPKED